MRNRLKKKYMYSDGFGNFLTFLSKNIFFTIVKKNKNKNKKQKQKIKKQQQQKQKQKQKQKNKKHFLAISSKYDF